MKYNIIYTLILSSIFIILEVYFRIENETLNNIIKLSNYIEIFLLFFALSFIPKRLSNIFVIFLATIFIIEILHYNYFGYFLFPMEFILFFTKIHEVIETGTTVLNILIFPIIFSLILGLAIKYTNKLTGNRIIAKKTIYIFFIFILLPIFNTGMHYKKRGLGDRPNTNKSIIKNGLYVTKSFLGKTLPLTLLNIQIVPKYENNNFEKNKKNKINNVILVIGESLSSHYMSLYGYDKNTTPNLLKLKQNDKNLLVLKAVSGGEFTDTSVPMILNVEKKPNAINHILSNKTNLFKLAKENNYNTYFISAQANDGFSYIRGYMGLKYIDKYIDSSNYGYDKYTSALDDMLIKEFKKIDLSKNNFIVLNMIGSHEPYETRVPKEFKPFGSKNHLENYCNSVSYTDKVINNLLEYIKKDAHNTLFIFTSDHGQHVTKNSLGKGNLNDIRDYQVPAIIYNNNFKINSNVVRKLKSTEFTSHYNLTLLVSHYLGYDTLKYIDTTKAYINGNELSGNGGYLEYNLITNKYKIE